MIFFLLRLSLFIIGITFLIVFTISSFVLIKTVYLSDTQLITHLFNNYEKCGESFVVANKELCERIATSYWMIFILIASLIISFITLFPFFIMRKKNDKNSSEAKK